jgi:hypothetical protein
MDLGLKGQVALITGFPASKRAAFITGSVYDIDGGVQKSL